MATKGRAFLNDVKQLLTLLVNLRIVSEDKSKEEEKIEATLKLMVISIKTKKIENSFAKGIFKANRKKIYIYQICSFVM